MFTHSFVSVQLKLQTPINGTLNFWFRLQGFSFTYLRLFSISVDGNWSIFVFSYLMHLLTFTCLSASSFYLLLPHLSSLQFCVFGSRLMGRGHYVFDRRWDRMRLVLQSMVEKHLNSQMWRWVCRGAQCWSSRAAALLVLHRSGVQSGSCELDEDSRKTKYVSFSRE